MNVKITLVDDSFLFLTTYFVFVPVLNTPVSYTHLYIDKNGNLAMEEGIFRKRVFVPEIAYNRVTYFKMCIRDSCRTMPAACTSYWRN